MNAQGRKVIEEYTATVEQLMQDLVSIRDEEQEKFDNMPNSFQQSDNAKKIEAAASALDDAIDHLGDCMTALQTSIE